MRQLGLAALNFENANGRFPPGYLAGRGHLDDPYAGIGPGWEADQAGPHQWVGVLVYLLPYFEELSAQDRYAATLDLGVEARDTPYWEDANAWEMLQWQLSMLLCPENPREVPQAMFLDRIYPRFDPPWLRVWAFGWTPDTVAQGQTHYLGVSGVWGELGLPHIDALVGIFSVRSKTRIAQITDGTSHTLLFGEAPGTIGRGIEDKVVGETYSGFLHAHSWAGTGTLPVVYGLDLRQDTPDLDSSGNAIVDGQYDAQLFHYGSLHPGEIVQFCLADGSVRQLDKKIDQAVLEALASIRGGEVAASAGY